MPASQSAPPSQAEIVALAGRIGEKLKAKGWSLALAESCTGGLASHLVTNVPGSSAWYKGGVVVYANTAKTSLLGVSQQILAEAGAVSRETVEAMALGVVTAFGSEVGAALSGVAGPGGGTPEKPVGTVWAAWVTPEGCRSEKFQFSGDREEIKTKSAVAALRGLEALVDAPRRESTGLLAGVEA